MSAPVLVAGIGNIFLSDDGFGVEVASRLARRELPKGVLLREFGIRGIHLAYELLDGVDVLVLIDAVPHNEPPGTLSVIEPDQDDLAERADAALDAHTMDPATVLATLHSLGGRVERVVIVGCQPESLEEGIGLSADVAAAVEPAVDMCIDLVSNLASGKGTAA